MRIFAQRLTVRAAALIVFETVLILTGVGVAAYLRLGDWTWLILPEEGGLQKALLVAAVCQLCFYYTDLYDLRVLADRRELFVRIVQATGSAALVLATIYFWFPALVLGRGVFMIAAFLVIPLIIGWRLFFDWIGRRVAPRERLLIVGSGNAALDLARELHERRIEFGVEIVGFVDADPALVGQPLINPGIIGTVDDIPGIVRTQTVDRVVVSLADARGRLPMHTLLEMKLAGVQFDHLASVYEEYTGKIAIENLRPSWLIFSHGFRKSRSLAAFKRVVDIGVAGIGLVLCLPLLALIGAAVRLTSTGPALYHQRRVGRYGREFTVHKFRSMRVDAEAHSGPVWAAKHGDPRTTRLGRVLRRSRLDELPQLWNVLVGDMSLVGPRPERPEFVRELTKQIPFYGQRHVVRPGLTGWAQIRYTYGASTEDAMEKLQYDLYYIKNLSAALDVFILLGTIKTVVLQRGA
jgi:sugar transferase (PEP-CTERM system associated)